LIDALLTLKLPLTKFNRKIFGCAYHENFLPWRIKIMMRNCFVLLFTVMLSLLISGCASTIRSEVTAFHDWPAEALNKSFMFVRTPQQENNLEHRAYENLVRNELQRLGFVESASPQSAAIKVGMNYDINVRDVRVVQPVLVDPWYGTPVPGPHWRVYGYYAPFYGPVHRPFWYAPPVVRQHETRYQLANRQLNIVMSRAADSKKLYDVTVISKGTSSSLPALMPYLVGSAFADFPGKNGVPRVIELKVKE
jgi:hypothetical protein